MAAATVAALVIETLTNIAESAGYPLIFLIVVMETGCGIPFAPGEIATVTGGIAAAEGKLSIELVILIAACAAIVGDNIGYLIGRAGRRRLLERPGPFMKQRQQVLRIGDPFFEKHGPKAVFFGRWLPVLRVYASWMAGGLKMPWRSFVVWNAAGGICWAFSMGLAGYFGGTAAKTAIEDFGAYGLLLVPVVLITVYLIYRRQQRRAVEALAAEAQADEARAAPAEGAS